jgi:hypothetical protein
VVRPAPTRSNAGPARSFEVPYPELVLSLLIELNGAALEVDAGPRERFWTGRALAAPPAPSINRSLDCPNPPTSPYLDRKAPDE